MNGSGFHFSPTKILATEAQRKPIKALRLARVHLAILPRFSLSCDVRGPEGGGLVARAEAAKRGFGPVRTQNPSSPEKGRSTQHPDRQTVTDKTSSLKTVLENQLHPSNLMRPTKGSIPTFGGSPASQSLDRGFIGDRRSGSENPFLSRFGDCNKAPVEALRGRGTLAIATFVGGVKLNYSSHYERESPKSR